MKKIQLLTLFVFLLLLNKVTLAQDTIVIKDRQNFEQIIKYSFVHYTEAMNADIRTEIDSLFSTYNFEGDDYKCQYLMEFFIDLDSC